MCLTLHKPERRSRGRAGQPFAGKATAFSNTVLGNQGSIEPILHGFQLIPFQKIAAADFSTRLIEPIAFDQLPINASRQKIWPLLSSLNAGSWEATSAFTRVVISSGRLSVLRPAQGLFITARNAR